MRNSVKDAREVKRFYNRLKRTCPKGKLYESDDPLELLMFGVLSENGSAARAKAALTRMLSHVVDHNDLRVSTADELAGIIGKDLPDARQRAVVLIRVLNAVYEVENAVSLGDIKSKNKRDARAYLEGLDGATPYAVASTMLWVFGEHTIPVDNQILETLAKEQLISPETDAAAAQALLKRHTNTSDAPIFAVVLKRYAVQRARKRTPVSGRKRNAKAKSVVGR